jgi:hypothetical protein
MADRTLELRLLQKSLTQIQRELAPRTTPSHDRTESQRLYRLNETPTTRRNKLESNAHQHQESRANQSSGTRRRRRDSDRFQIKSQGIFSLRVRDADDKI